MPSPFTSAAFACSAVSPDSLPVDTSAYTARTFEASLESTILLPFMSPRGRVGSSVGGNKSSSTKFSVTNLKNAVLSIEQKKIYIN